MCSFQPYLQFYTCSPVTINLTWPITDIGMIFVIVVLPVGLFLMTPDSHQKRESDKDGCNAKKSKDDSLKNSKEHAEPSPVVQAQVNALMKNDGRILERFAGLPDELCAGIAQYLDLKDVAAVSASCQHFKRTLQTPTVWQILGNRHGVQIKNMCVNESKELIRLAVWRLRFDCIKDLAIEVKRHPPGDPAAPTSRLLAEASLFIQKLLPCDEMIAMELSELLRPSLTNAQRSNSVSAAQELVKSARRSSLPWVVFEDIANSYEHGVLQQNLFESCMQEHEDMLNDQLSELEASIDEECKMQIDFDLSALLQV